MLSLSMPLPFTPFSQFHTRASKKWCLPSCCDTSSSATWASLWRSGKLPGNQRKTSRKTSIIKLKGKKKRKKILITIYDLFWTFLQLWRKIEESAADTHVRALDGAHQLNPSNAAQPLRVAALHGTWKRGQQTSLCILVLAELPDVCFHR